MRSYNGEAMLKELLWAVLDWLDDYKFELLFIIAIHALWVLAIWLSKGGAS